MKASFVFGFILLILFIIGIFVGAPYAAQIIKSGAFELPFSLPFSLPKITTQFRSDYFKIQPQTSAPSVQKLPKIGESIYKDKINIESVYFSGGGQLSLKSSYFSKDSVNITGWKIKSVKKGETIIGKAVNIPQFDSALSDIILSGSDSVDIVIGSSPLGNNFRGNNCFGWLSTIYSIDYSIDYCPGKFKIEELTDLDSSCQDLILRTSACRAPIEDVLNNQTSQCRDWALKNMNYNSCVSNHKNDSNFFKVWKIYTGNNNQIFDPLHDRIELRDQNGLLVDTNEY